MIKSCLLRSHGRYSKRPPSILRQKAVRRITLSLTRLNMLTSTVGTVAWSLATNASTVLKRTEQTRFFRCPSRKISELDPANVLAMQSALHVQSTFLDMKHSSTAHFPTERSSSVVLKQQTLPHRDAFSVSSSRTVSRKSHHRWATACQRAHDSVFYGTSLNTVERQPVREPTTVSSTVRV
jgi:hypothetical protein